ncbi:hypothetical protein FHU38_003414 [Saccharomonospora amisosensis]|uniref:Uncharacterized protein n=1 Tax=Saccharomonospora amisosensis TaxID=1128677 RepID=A0A7X5URX4_9PSEU|nr:hypothetical protein [Saccharomonospora amisosensis]
MIVSFLVEVVGDECGGVGELAQCVGEQRRLLVRHAVSLR